MLGKRALLLSEKRNISGPRSNSDFNAPHSGQVLRPNPSIVGNANTSFTPSVVSSYSKPLPSVSNQPLNTINSEPYTNYEGTSINSIPPGTVLPNPFVSTSVGFQNSAVSSNVGLQNTGRSQFSNISYPNYQNGPSPVNGPPSSNISKENLLNGPNSSAVLPEESSRFPPSVSTNSSFNQMRFPNVYEPRPHYQPLPVPPPPPPAFSVSQPQTIDYVNTVSGIQSSQFGSPGNNIAVPPKAVPFTGPISQNPLLPLPFSGQNLTHQSSLPATGASEPPSAKSSRNPSPIPPQRYDSMEGQFPTNKPSPSGSASNLQSLGSVASKSFVPHIQSSSSLIDTTSAKYSYPVGTDMQQQTMPHNLFSQSSTIYSSPPQSSNVPGLIRPRYPQQVVYSQPGNVTVPPDKINYSGMIPPDKRDYSQPSGISADTNSLRSPPSYISGPNLPEGPVGGLTGYDPNLHARMAGMSVHGSLSRMWGNEGINLLQDRNILPPAPVEPPKPALPQDKPNCNPDIFRCTLTKIPESHSLLQKSRLPFGILIHPFKDVKHLPVVQCGTIVRCRSCRTYINPFVIFVDQRRWKCNLCFRINDLPEEFLYDPMSKSYGDPSRRPEIRNSTIEFIAPSEYMLRPPQPAVYLFLLDVSHSAVETGYLSVFCKILLEELDNLPGDARMHIGFITYNSSIHFYNLAEGLNQPHMLVVSDIEDVFLPSPDNLLVNLQENKELIQDLLNEFPKRFACSGDTNSALGAALQAGYKLMSPTGGRITVMQTCLPNIGPGALKIREDPNMRASKDIAHLGPANDFYKKLALDCSGQQIAVDLFLLSSQYADIATLSCISKYSAGSVLYYPCFHISQTPLQVEKYKNDLHRYLTRKIGFEAVMRIRCTRGLSIHTFHGNFFVRSTDLLSLPNVNPDVGFAMQISIEDNLTDSNTVCFQAAVLYTSSKGERRIRVHTLSLPVVSILSDVLGSTDQQAVIGLLAKMAVDRSLSSSLSDAKEALINACIDLINSFKITQSSQIPGALMMPISSKLMPLYVLGLLKHAAFRTGVSTKLDERVYSMEQMKTVPLSNLLTYIYPNLYPIHNLDDKNAINEDNVIIPQPPLLQLSFEKIDRHGAYLLDTLDHIYLYVGRAVSDYFCANVLGVPNFSAIPFDLIQLPELKTPESERIKNFLDWLSSQRPFHAPLSIIREDGKDKQCFLQHMVDDRTESLFSYYEFLQHLKLQTSK